MILGASKQASKQAGTKVSLITYSHICVGSVNFPLFLFNLLLYDVLNITYFFNAEGTCSPPYITDDPVLRTGNSVLMTVTSLEMLYIGWDLKLRLSVVAGLKGHQRATLNHRKLEKRSC